MCLPVRRPERGGICSRQKYMNRHGYDRQSVVSGCLRTDAVVGDERRQAGL